MYNIEASVPTGFESVAAEEAKEMFQTECTAIRGKITVQTPAESVKDILKLGGIDHCRAQILRIPYFGFTDDGDDCLARLQLLVKQCDWALGLEIWNKFFSFPHPISPHPDTIPSDEQLINICYSKHMPGREPAGAAQGKKKKQFWRAKKKGNKAGEKPAEPGAASDQAHVEEEEEKSLESAQHIENNSEELPGHQASETSGTPEDSQKPGDNGAPAEGSPDKKASRQPPDPTKPVFRVTCKRTGENHSFDSMSAAASLGSAIQTYFGWAVDMTNFNIEVMLTIDNHEVTMGLTLTPESLHKRNLVAFGVTTLRPTICHNMLRMVKIKPGHVVCDPLCGTASIPIQGALSFPALQLCGDNHEVAMKKTLANHTALNEKRQAAGKGALMMDAVRWNAFYLPLRDGIVDVFVSDLPFGKRVGRKYENLKLYCLVLDEMARCGKLSGRAALLTGDMNNMVKAIQAQKYWTRRRCYSCNIGGIAAAVFLLFRSNVPYTPPSQSQTTHHHHHDHAPPPVSDPQASQNSHPSEEAEARDIPSNGEGGDDLPLAGETLVEEG